MWLEICGGDDHSILASSILHQEGPEKSEAFLLFVNGLYWKSAKAKRKWDGEIGSS
jgi:hypothetical protein